MSKYENIKNKLLNNNQEMIHIGMNYINVTNDKSTTLFTNAIATCYGLGIVAKDNEGNIYRIVSHNYAFSEGFQLRQLESITKYLTSINNLTDLRVVCCTMESLKDFDNLDEIEQEAIENLNKTFMFYKKSHPDFSIEFQRSWYIIVDFNGNIEYATKELIDEYEQEDKRQLR